MSSRSRKRTTQVVEQHSSQESTSSAGVSTPVQQHAGRSPARGARPPSPTTISRMHEKQELAGLNDRLAMYIDRVRELETANAKLTRQIRTYEESSTTEVSSLKSIYEGELSDARKLLDDLAREKAKLQISLGKAEAEAKDYREKLQASDRELKDKDRRLLSAEAQVSDLQARLTDAVNQRKHWENEYSKLVKEVAELQKQLATIRKQLEDETLTRVDLQNRVQSLKEELAFKSSVHQQELNESRSRTRVEIEEVDGRLQDEYESRLYEAVQEMRRENDAVIQAAKTETEEFYTKKLEELRGLMGRTDASAETAKKDLKAARIRIDELSNQVVRLSTQNANLESRVRDLESQLSREQDEHLAALESRDAEIRRLRELLEEQMVEYRDLLGVKIQLDNEIATYRRLLESEETRLNISSSTEASPFQTRGGRSGRKRKRGDDETDMGGSFMMSQSSANAGYQASGTSSGPLEISETDSEGKFVKLQNSSDKDVSLAGYRLEHHAGSEETAYKFHRNIVLKAGESCTVWSSDSDTTHNPPSDLVMKGKRFFVADSMKTMIYDSDGQEIATREMKKSVKRTSYFSSTSAITSRETHGENQERCMLM